MRIISGRLRGRRLVSPIGMNTRPTADRVREALFNILGPKVRDASVLDLFAGAGTLGLEALSRGAAFAVFADIDLIALAAIRENIQRCGLDKSARAIRCDAAASLDLLQGLGRSFDLIFMDPPYGRNLVRPALVKLYQSGLLAGNARVVVEHGAGDPVEDKTGVFVLTDARKYGKTRLSFLEWRRTTETSHNA